jgi:hypothetical protein
VGVFGDLKMYRHIRHFNRSFLLPLSTENRRSNNKSVRREQEELGRVVHERAQPFRLPASGKLV